MVTTLLKVRAAASIMTDGCGWPDIMHGPYYGFPGIKNLTDSSQRKHALVDPVQVNDISLLELTQTSYISAAIGNINLKKMLALEMQTTEDNQALPKEIPAEPYRWRQSDDSQRIALLVAHQHTSLYPVIVQGFHQTIGCHRGPTRPFTGIDNQNLQTWS